MSIKPAASTQQMTIENTVRGYGPGAVHLNSFFWTCAAVRGEEAQP
jgi:hypothetical protein